MFDWLKAIILKIKNISSSIDQYKKDTIVQSLPSLAYVNRAKKFLEQNRYDEAEQILLEALELPQKDALVYKYLGAVYERTGKQENAVKHYQISADLAPQDKTIWQRLGFSLMSVGKFEQAEKSFENANKVHANNTDTFTGWGMALMKQKKYNEAREKFTQASQINRYNFSAVFLCAVMEIKLEMYDKADAKLSFLANVCPNESNTFEYARLKALRNDLDSAIHYATKSIEFNSKMLPAYILLGQLYAEKNDSENSLKFFELAQEKELNILPLYLEWGKVLTKFEKYEQAIEKFNQALDKENGNQETLTHLALCYALTKNCDKAKELLPQNIDNLTTQQTLAIIAFEENDFKKAIEILRQNDENWLNCFYLAKSYKALNENNKVKDYFELAITNNPKAITPYIEYSKYLIELNDYTEAQRKLRKALKFNETDFELLNLMFYVSYILVKETSYEYNIKETLSIAERIQPDLFKYPEQKEELLKLLPENKERE